ncbi:MAG: GNAT family N-acetyltransferase [Hyphomicrobiales bacterium]
MTSDQCTLRNGTTDDLSQIVEIYNYYVRETAITFDIKPTSVGARAAWLAQFSDEGPHQLIVAETNGEIHGYAYAAAFRPRPAYARSVEVTIYLKPGAEGRGLGRKVYERLLKRIDESGAVHRAYAVIGLPNEASILLHERMGFQRLHVLSEVGHKFGRYWDTLWMEKRF